MNRKTREKYLSRSNSGNSSNSFTTLIEEWLAYLQTDSVSPNTLLDYKTKTNLFLLWLKANHSEHNAHPKLVTVEIARKFADYLKTPQAERWSRKQKNATLSETSIESYGRNMRIFYNWLLKQGYVEVNPFSAQYVKFRSGKKNRTIKALKTEDIVKLFNYLENHRSTFAQKRDYALIALALDSGVRRAELLSMKTQDVDMLKMCFKVQGKTGSALCYFSEKCKSLLQEYTRAKAAEFTTLPEAFWLSVDGKPLTVSAINSIAERIKLLSGVNFSWHKFRHTSISLMASRIPAFEVMKIAHHENISTTLGYYSNNPDITGKLYQANAPLKLLEGSLPQMKRKGRPKRNTL